MLEEVTTVAWFDANATAFDPSLQDVRFLTTTPADLREQLPVVKFTGNGGPMKLNSESPGLSVECFAAKKVSALALMRAVDSLMRYRFRGVVPVTIDGDPVNVFVSGVGVTLSPLYVPYDNPNVYRYICRYRLYLQDLDPVVIF